MARIIEVVEGPNGPTLGGDIEKLTARIAKHCHCGTVRARNLLSQACERIEQSCDEIEELQSVTVGDILSTAASIQFGE